MVAVVDVEEAYIHCAKALRRASLWDTGSWLDGDEIPSATCMLRDHAKIDVPIEDLDKGYQADVDATLWKPGGRDVD